MADEGVKYFPLYCTLDEKFELIEAEFGLKGFAIVVKLFQRIYGEHGYYCEWNNDISLIFAKQCGFSNIGEVGALGCAEKSLQSGKPKNLIDLVVNASVRRGIFDEQLFSKYSILTSRGIQRNFLNIVRNRKKVEIKKEYLLLSDVKIKGNIVIIDETYVRNDESDVSFRQSKVKESKVNKNHCAPAPHDSSKTDKEFQLKKDFEIIYGIYPKKRGRTVAFSNYKLWVGKGKDVGGKKYRLTNKQIYLAVKKYIQQQEEAGQDDYRYWKNFDTLMGRQLLDYVEWGEIE